MQEQNKDVNSMITTAVHHARYNIHDIMFRDRFLGIVEDFYSSFIDIKTLSISEKNIQHLDAMIHCYVLLKR